MYASAYARQYTQLVAELYDGVGEASIDKYLNAGLTAAAAKKANPDKTFNPDNFRADRALKAKDRLLGEIQKDLKVKRIPNVFEIDGYAFKLYDCVIPFFGKGSPSNIRDVLWLASKYKHLTQSTLRAYTDKYLGLDCNGFVGNLWGMHPSTSIDQYDRRRRKRFEDVDDGDALVFYKKGTLIPAHIATIDWIETIDASDSKKAKLNFWLTQSAGNEDGVRTTQTTWNLVKTPQGDVYYETGKHCVYVVQGPEKNKPNGLEWAMSNF